MRFFKRPWFQRFAEKEGISDESLKAMADDMENGKINAELGGYVYKQRLAREGGGKSGGYRLLVFFRREDRIIWVYAFSKSDRDNITQRELVVLKKEAAAYMALSDAQLSEVVRQKELLEF